MATSAQKEFFAKLVEERQFPNGAPSSDELVQQFEELSDKTASEWIARAVSLPKRDDSEGRTDEPPF